MTRMIPPRVAELLCSRLCHDLISPISAIGNGLEFLADSDPQLSSDAIGLVGSSATQAAARLAFYRLAFGAGGGDAQTLKFSEIQKTVVNFIADKNIELDWSPPAIAPDATLSTPFCKLLFNMTLLASEALPRGGRLSLELPPLSGEDEITVVARGEPSELRPGMEAAMRLDAAQSELTPLNVNAHYTALLADAIGMQLVISGENATETEIVAQS